MSEYPEHIDQIDDFYRSQLADHEIEPPEGLWSKISMGALETPSPEVKAAARFSNTQKYLGLLAGTVILVAGTLYFYNRKDSSAPDQKVVPVIEQPLDSGNTNSSSHTEGTPLNTITPSNQLKEKKNLPASTNSAEEKTDIAPSVENNSNQSSESSVEQQPVITAPAEEQKVDTTAEIKTTQKAAPKEKIKFKDKYKKDYQDSTRKIFVPGK